VVTLSQTASPLEVVYTVGALFAIFFFFILLIIAMRDSIRISDLPNDHPDRMIANDATVNEVIRVLLAVGILAIGIGATVTPPARESTNASPSVEGVVVFVVLLFWEVTLIGWGIKDLWFRRRIFKRMESVRLVCVDSTFAGCPFINGAAQKPVRPENLVDPPPMPPSKEDEE
jgi:hypothetical protein